MLEQLSLSLRHSRLHHSLYQTEYPPADSESSWSWTSLEFLTKVSWLFLMMKAAWVMIDSLCWSW